MSTTPFYQSYLPYLLAQAAHKQSIRFHRELKARGVRELDWRILAILADHAPRTVNDLAKETIVPQPTMSRRLAQMEKKGLIERSVDRRDARVMQIVLTASGRKLAADLIARAKAAEARDAAVLTKQAQKQLCQMLNQLIAIDAGDNGKQAG